MCQPTTNPGSRRVPATAFTLTELLVVLAVTGILAAMLLPALARAKSRAQTIICLDNLRQLELCHHLYITDSNDFFVPNNSMAEIDSSGSDGSVTNGLSWHPGPGCDHGTGPFQHHQRPAVSLQPIPAHLPLPRRPVHPGNAGWAALAAIALAQL
jgi:prepilin-type N-terminal cleavage/methylation domain-containing protein